MFLLIDGSYYVARAKSRLANLSNKDGFPTGGIFGGLNMIGSDLSKVQPEYCCVVFDNANDKTVPERVAIYADYKANRAPKDKKEKEERRIKHIQRKTVMETLNMCGIKSVFGHDGWEADDTLASLAQKAADAGQRVLILTGDKDLAAMVNSKIHVLDTKTTDGTPIKDYWRESLSELAVKDKFGVLPNQMRDYLALNGDSVDNIPGVPGISKELAAELISKYGSIKKLYKAFVANEEDLGINRKKARGTLDSKEWIKRNLALVALNTELIDNFDLKDYKINFKSERRTEAAKMLADLHQFKNIPQSLAKYLDTDSKISSLRNRASMFD